MLDSTIGGSAVIGHGRYRLGQRIGGGGSSDVYRAVDTVLQRPVAVKLFKASADPTAELRFEAEARLLAPLAHPALVTIYDTGVEQGRAYQVLQLVEGRTLHDRIVDAPLGADDVRAIGARLSEALAYVHAQGIVHRDIKPSNVLGDGDQVYLADFGISRLLDGAHLTATGMAVGTAAYMAPEQVRGDEVGPAADVYSLGLVLLESLTGRREYAGGVTETAMARLSRPPLVPTWLPAPLAALLTAMTSDDPRERPSAEACAAALRDGVPVVDTPTSPATDALPAAPDPEEPGTQTLAWPAPPAPVTGSEPAQGRRRRWARTGLAATAVAAALAVGVFAMVDGDKPDQAPADTKPTPTVPASGSPAAPAPGTSTRQAEPGGKPSTSPRVVVPPPSRSNPPATTEPSPSQEPTESPSAEPSSSGDSGEGEGEGDATTTTVAPGTATARTGDQSDTKAAHGFHHAGAYTVYRSRGPLST